MDQGVSQRHMPNVAIYTKSNTHFSDALKSCKYVIEHLI